jgi:hypothetical protein
MELRGHPPPWSHPTKRVPSRSPDVIDIPRVWALPGGRWVNYFAGQLPIEAKCPDPPDRVSPAARGLARPEKFGQH